MSGESLLLDTNAFIYFFEGRSRIAERVLLADAICYSAVTEIELLSAPRLLQIKTPDAIIAASAEVLGLPLVTADTRFVKVPNLRLITDILD